jgi:hypothetical protein
MYEIYDVEYVDYEIRRKSLLSKAPTLEEASAIANRYKTELNGLVEPEVFERSGVILLVCFWS